jgi:hypothetical protein
VQELCPEIASSLNKLLAMEEEQVEMLGLSFAVSMGGMLGLSTHKWLDVA